MEEDKREKRRTEREEVGRTGRTGTSECKWEDCQTEKESWSVGGEEDHENKRKPFPFCHRKCLSVPVMFGIFPETV